MIIVQGVFRVAADLRDEYLRETVETQRISRAERGCIEYVLAADPLDAERVVLSERWETRADLEAHGAALAERRRAAKQAGKESVPAISTEVLFFEASATDFR